ncbi:trans-enoyl-CoA reductase family protein [Powellomyces hirtus]|nr:trans-enoyl-CoA reductase family protein [Powellomyces hirtus]
MQASKELCSLLRIQYPILLSPMLNVSTPQLVASLSNRGGCGLYGAASSSAEDLTQIISNVRRLTTKPFGVNLFVPEPHDPVFSSQQSEAIAESHRLLNKFRDRLGMAPITSPRLQDTRELFEQQVDTVIQQNVPILSFHFGIPSEATLAKVKARGIVTIGTATNITEALELAIAGVDIICAQGSEAGGHRGTWITDDTETYRDGLVGLMAFIPEICSRVNVPVVAAGGIMSGAGIEAAMDLGAAGVQMGTAFLTTTESAASSAHKAAILDHTAKSTIVTQAFTGRAARALTTSPIPRELDRVQHLLPNTFCLMARDMYGEAKEHGVDELTPMFAGQGFHQARNLPAGDLFDALLSEARAAGVTFA